MFKLHCVYLMASAARGTLYCGSTSNLIQRVYQHKTDAVAGFSCRYQVHRLVWFEAHRNARSLVVRERQIKEWQRSWKVRLVEAENPLWHDHYGERLRGPSLKRG